MEGRPRILVVDDEPRSRELLVRTLRKGAEIASAASADEAFSLFEEKAFRLVITDQRMPGTSASPSISSPVRVPVMTSLSELNSNRTREPSRWTNDNFALSGLSMSPAFSVRLKRINSDLPCGSLLPTHSPDKEVEGCCA